MRITTDKNSVSVDTPCKINPFLEVVRRRPDGFHDLDTVMIAVDLCDTLHFERLKSGKICLDVQSDSSWIGSDIQYKDRLNVSADDNIILKALVLLRAELQSHDLVFEDCGISVRLTKRIPLQAGLGGGSSDAAATLIAAQLLWTGGVDLSIAGRLAARLGSDVNFFLESYNGCSWAARCTGRGELISPIPLSGGIRWLIVCPNGGCDTASVFRSLDLSQRIERELRTADEPISALQSSDLTRIRASVFNRLFESAARVCKPVEDVSKKLDGLGELGIHVMSGSGSTIVVPVASEGAERFKQELVALLKCPVYVAQAWETGPIQEQIPIVSVEQCGTSPLGK